MKVLVSDKLSPKAVEVFKENGVDVDVKVGMSEDELCKVIGDYDGLAIRSATKVTKKVIDAAKNLKVVGRAGIGVDNVDIPVATAKGVVVMNTPFGNSVTTAEHTIALLMSVARTVPQANSSTHAGKWEKSKFMGVEVTGKVLGLIGCGNIGSIVVSRAQGLKMKVLAYDPYLSEERAKELNIEKVELDDVFARSDFITLHTPLNDATRGIVNAGAFKKMKKGVRIINCARGGLVVEKDLKEAIVSGKVAGAALDVYEEEPAKKNDLFGMEEVICTPHLGASTTEAQENVAVQVAEQMSAYLCTGAVTNALNIPSVSEEDAAVLLPYITLGSQLGQFVGQLTESSISSVEISYEGAAAELNVKPITSVLLTGLLKSMTASVNLVNAPVLAKERGIDVREVTRQNCENYNSLIRLKVKTEKDGLDIAGTLFAENRPRIVEVGDVKLEAGLGKTMLYVNNEDKPGLIGNLGKVLGDDKINIASFHLGRGKRKGDAVALVTVDQVPSAALLKKVDALPSVIYSKLLCFD